MAPSIGNVIEGPFLESVRSSFGENLLSVMAYGSYASGGFVPGVSDVNILVILKEPRHEQIVSFGRAAHRLLRKHRITPLILTRREFANSADVFPVEYYDIRERNLVLHGEDETQSLSLTRQNLRHQLEERLRGTVANLRQMLVASRGRGRVVDRAMKNLFGSLKALFRGLLRLKEPEQVPLESGELIEAVCRQFGVDPSPFSKLQELRSKKQKATAQLAGEVLGQIEGLIKKVDAVT